RASMRLRDLEEEGTLRAFDLGDAVHGFSRALYSTEALAGMVIDYAALNQARWVQKADQRDVVLASLAHAELASVYPEDIVLWSSLPSARSALAVGAVLGRLPHMAQIERALAEELSLCMPDEERMALALPRLLLLDWDLGHQLAAALG